MLARAAAATLAFTGLLAACGKGAPDECAAYAKRDWECGNYPASEKDITLKLAEGFCREIRSGNKDLAVMADVKAGPGCVRSTSTCEEFRACLQKAREASWTPPP